MRDGRTDGRGETNIPPQQLRCIIKKTLKIHLVVLCGVNLQVTNGFPSQRVSSTETVSPSYGPHVACQSPVPIPYDDCGSIEVWPTNIMKEHWVLFSDSNINCNYWRGSQAILGFQEPKSQSYAYLKYGHIQTSVSPIHTSSMVTYKLQSVLSIPQVWSHRNFRQSYAYPKYGHIETSVSPIHTSSMVTYKLQSVLSIPQVWSHRNFRQSYAYPKYGHVQTSVSPIHTPSMVTYKLPSVLSISPIHTPSMVTYKLSSVPSIPQVWSIYKLPSVLSIPQVWSHTNFRQSYAYPKYGHIQTSVSPMHTPSMVTYKLPSVLCIPQV